jgi:hypothetical protein
LETVSLPKPEPGLVIRYSYLWRAEYLRGQEEGVKDRPCAIVLAPEHVEDGTHVVVLPVTHSPPDKTVAALEIPPAIKRLLGLDSERSWVVLSESNRFRWPGPDLRRVGDRDDSSVAYGFLPPRFFAELYRRFIALEDVNRSRRVTRTE